MKMPVPLRARPDACAVRNTSIPETRPGLIPQGDVLCCTALCSGKAGFAACLARCLATGQACDGGLSNCTPGC